MSTRFRAAIIGGVALALGAVGTPPPQAVAALPAGNVVAQWNRIAEDAVVRSGAFQNEGLIYMAYASAGVYAAVLAIEGGYEHFGPSIEAAPGASSRAAAIEAAYRVLVNYFPSQAGILDALYAEALGEIPDGDAKADGQAVGLESADNVIAIRSGDGRMATIGASSPFLTRPPGAGVWRLTPPAFAAPQTPWVGNVRPFVLPAADQFLPDPPPETSTLEWAHAFEQIKAWGAATGSARDSDQTAVARFWSANVIRQYNGLTREIADTRDLDEMETARLSAMVNVIGADAQISVMHAKYHYAFWRPVTAIDPTAVTNDGYGPVPGYDDGNPATAEQPGWRPLLTTPNHPEYPAAHGSITSAMAEVLSDFLGTNRIDLDIRGFDASGPAGNLSGVRHFDRVSDLRREIVDARLWAGLHYPFSSVAGVVLGRNVAKYDLAHAFRAID